MQKSPLSVLGSLEDTFESLRSSSSDGLGETFELLIRLSLLSGVIRSAYPQTSDLDFGPNQVVPVVVKGNHLLVLGPPAFLSGVGPPDDLASQQLLVTVERDLLLLTLSTMLLLKPGLEFLEPTVDTAFEDDVFSLHLLTDRKEELLSVEVLHAVKVWIKPSSAQILQLMSPGVLIARLLGLVLLPLELAESKDELYLHLLMESPLKPIFVVKECLLSWVFVA